ncbi:MAG: hypothetical protein MZW92_44455 [Comamonadaceae bacterium]|nr:hypothetical protein [Comamonadaceae bacterium]
MEGIKRFFGVLLIATAIWMVSPVLPAWLQHAGLGRAADRVRGVPASVRSAARVRLGLGALRQGRGRAADARRQPAGGRRGDGRARRADAAGSPLPRGQRRPRWPLRRAPSSARAG